MSERLNGSRPRSSTPSRGPVVQTRTPGSNARRGRRKENTENFHPKLITTQIVCIQCLHYVLLGFLFQMNYLFFNKSITIDRMFTDNYVRIWKPSGWADVSALLLGSLFGYGPDREIKELSFQRLLCSQLPFLSLQ